MAHMNPEDWNQIKQVFSAALALPPPERDAYVRRAAADRPGLGDAVDELLRAHYGASQSFLEPGSVLLSAPWLLREGESVAKRFTVVRRIARGAMGEVYQVHDERLRQSVALKAIRPELIGDADTAERFRREVLVTRNIGHPCLCKVFDLVEHQIDGRPGVPDGTIVPCLTMQLLEGQSLEEWLAARRPMTVQEALPLIAQIGDALQALHDAGVVHRDLKPSNVMITTTPDGPRAVLTDFGLARPLKTDLFETKVRVQGGAPYFMAPELFESQRPSRASDMYAFGLLIDEMVTARRAFASDSLHGLLLEKLGDGPERPSRRSTALPRACEQAILRCLSRDPRDRPASASGVAASLGGHASRRRALLAPSLGARVSRRFRYATAVATVVVGGAVLVPLHSGSSVVFIQPFTNLTGQADLDYLSVATASELGRRLSRLPDVRVYRPSEPLSPDAALDGTLTLSGHIQGGNDLLRVTVELKDAATNTLIWSHNVDGRRDRALQLQEQLGAASVGALTRVDADRQTAPVAWTSLLFRRVFATPRLPPQPTTNNQAYSAYLRAVRLYEDRTKDSALAALTLLHKAVDADPNFALAYALMADLQGVLMDNRTASHARFIEEADRYASLAVALQPDLADAQLSLAAVRQAQWRWTEAEAAYLRAIALFRGSAVAHRWYGGLKLQFGRFDESLELYRRSMEIDPYDVPGRSAYGHALFHAGRAREAAALLEDLLEKKDLVNAHTLLGQVYAYLGRAVPSERERYLRKALAESDIVRRHESAGGRAATTPRADLLAALAWSYQSLPVRAAPFVARLERGRVTGDVTAATLARIYGAQGDTRRAMAALLEAEAQRDRDLLYVNVSPHYTTIRQDPAFRALVTRLKLAD
jgi:eukaryotic-like serine/threonine-protein kinase